jgi:4-hydroxybenzoate polyprenyltransferase
MKRWWTYQRERFPIAGHGPLILAFSFSAVSYSRMLRNAPGFPPLLPAASAFVSCFLFFLQLRIADEFKDFEEDSAFRPYRPVPRGLVTLRQLALVFLLAAATQLALALVLRPDMAFLLLVVWTYLAGMSKEFFVRDWLKARPLTYMLSHMLIMPLVDFYATGCDWLASAVPAPSGLSFFLVASFCNGMVIEIGRKIRSPADEEPGVETYSALWGRPRAVAAWILALTLTTTFALLAAHGIHFLLPAAVVLGAFLAIAVLTALRFLRSQRPGQGRTIELSAGLWTLALYLSLGAIPIAWRVWSGRHP